MPYDTHVAKQDRVTVESIEDRIVTGRPRSARAELASRGT
jgi:hypothetical protein